MSNYIIIHCSCPDNDQAKKLADSLISNSLAACINIITNMTSIYKWQGKVCEEPETLLLIKTHKNMFNAVKTHIQSAHPYELPEIIAVSIIQGSQAYLDWISNSIPQK